MERAKRKRYFEQELFENLVTFGCNPQWHELMETCQKIGSANDASNLTRAVEMFLASEKTNPSEYPVDYICKHGDLDMFKTFIKLAKFDLDENQPILKNKLTPYAADHDNLPIAIYLITKMDMEFRISLFENCMAQRDQKLSRFYKAATFTSYVFLGCKGPKLKANTTEKIHGVLLILFQQGPQIITIN